jgi:phosphoglucosamine mutase
MEAMSRRYFGTDGIRGVAGTSPMTAEFAFLVGVAAAEALKGAGRDAPTVLIGRDTRRSGQMLLAALSAGLTSRGAHAVELGVLPTPGVSHLCRTLGAAAGIVISASHNPFEDNGIKFFSAEGEKLSDALELEIEGYLERAGTLEPVTGAQIGTSRRYDRERGHEYRDFLVASGPDLSGLTIGLDCANGAAFELAPEVFTLLGAEVRVIHADPDGVNINTGCGSTHPEAIQQFVREQELDLGVTFDGDADRALLVDRAGRLISGDHMLAICALHRKEQGVVSTVMGNLGLEHYLAAHGVSFHRAAVGDRYVHEMLRAKGLSLGGEQSGHVLFLDKAPTGDGILSALQTLAAVQSSDKPLSSWFDEITMYPQTLLNVRVAPEVKARLAEHAQVVAALDRASEQLNGEGRVNVRPSGTEPLVRVMVEGRDQGMIEQVARDIAAVVEQATL